jgi:hypothetical protein
MNRAIPWVIIVMMDLAVAWLVYRAWPVESEADRAVEAKQLEIDDQIVELQKTRDALNHDLDIALNENAKLSDALDEARKAAPGATVVRVVRASTGPIVVCGEPRSPPETKPSGNIDDRSGLSERCVCPPGPPCLLAKGDTAEVRVSEVDLLTKAGNQVVVGTADCRRVSPPPETSLARGPFEARLTTVSELELPKPETAPGLGLGVAAFASGSGTALGVAFGAPPLRLWALQLDLTLAGGTGTAGLQGSATVLGRFWR